MKLENDEKTVKKLYLHLRLLVRHHRKLPAQLLIQSSCKYRTRSLMILKENIYG